MTKERKAQIATILVLAAGVGVAVLRKTDARASFAELVQRSEPTPQETVYAMLEAGRSGDVAKYLACHTGEMEESLRRVVLESADFAQYLRNSNAALKGIAVTEPQVLSAREVRVRVEYVFQDRNEIQFMHLDKTPGGWKISQVDSADRIS